MPRHAYAGGRRLFNIGLFARWYKTYISREITRLADGELYHHSKKNCRGIYCSLHRPMSGPWDSWRLKWSPEYSSMDRVCPHNVAHPAAEQYSYWRRTREGWRLEHNCDGCPCTPDHLEGQFEPRSLPS